ncbi:MAG: RagB/SusD family nutrient uptake outer membrane protein, partial [Algicola sp.]|nr:RagB/SusD family nutrient uptake outer membrane protein [Algicola sp.]
MKAFIQKILMTLLVGMLVIACSDDWLDETSNAKITADQQFSDEDGFKDALMGVYLGMTSPKLYAKDMTWNLVDLLAQQYATLPSLALYDEVQQFNYRGPQATDQVDALWIRSYNILANINLALEYIDDNQEVLNPINYAIIKGELLGLRVFVHLDLMRLYGYGNLEER